MGTREDLLAATKQCLAERGYARTTVRDIVAASGANLAAINYHFGTRDNLLHQAMLESTGAAVQHLLDALPAADTAPADRLNAFWHTLIGSFTTDRPLWAANIESAAQALHSPVLRTETADKQAEARAGLTHALGNGDPAAGTVLQTLIGGLLVQHLIDPDRAPTPETLATGLRALADQLAPQ